MPCNKLQQAWSRQATLDAEHGLIQCRICGQRSELAHATTLWRDQARLFAVCDRCAASHEVFVRTSKRGIQVRGRRVAPLVEEQR